MGVRYFDIDPELNDKSKICHIITEKLKDEKYEMAFKNADFNASTEMDTQSFDEDTYTYFNIFDDDNSIQIYKNKSNKSNKLSKHKKTTKENNKQTKKK